MIIKRSNQVVRLQQGDSFRQMNSFRPSQQATFHAKLGPNANYFTVLHHIISKNTPIKQFLKQYNAQYSERCFVSNHQNESLCENSKVQNKNNALENKNQLANSRLSQSFRSSHRPNWKDSILRRKNNGANGKIIKGKSENHYSCIVNRLKPQQLDPTSKRIQDEIQAKFSPVGQLKPKNICQSQQKRRKLQQILNEESYYFPTEKNPVDERLRKRKRKRKINIDTTSKYFNKTCLPLNNANKILQSTTKIKSLSTNTLINNPRGFTPRPWETVHQS